MRLFWILLRLSRSYSNNTTLGILPIFLLVDQTNKPRQTVTCCMAIFEGIQKCTIISIYSVDIENERG